VGLQLYLVKRSFKPNVVMRRLSTSSVSVRIQASIRGSLVWAIFGQACPILCTILVLTCNTPTDLDPHFSDPRDTTTTSDDFLWTSYLIGQAGYLCTITGISATGPNSVWLSGDIRFENTGKRDSLGWPINPYQLAHWNGGAISYLRVKWRDCWDAGAGIALDVAAVSDTELWVATNGNLSLWNGHTFLDWSVPDMSFSNGCYLSGIKRSGKYLFLYGRKGTLIRWDCDNRERWDNTVKHYDKIFTGTASDFVDAWTTDRSAFFLTAPAMEDSIYGKPRVYVYENGGLAEWSNAGIAAQLSTLWLDGGGHLFATGTRTQEWNGTMWEKMPMAQTQYLYAIRGCAANDLFAVGVYGAVWHWNGCRWTHLPEVDPSASLIFRYLACTRNNVFIVAWDHQGRKYLYHGRRK
jgi:hypothetical protein